MSKRIYHVVHDFVMVDRMSCRALYALLAAGQQNWCDDLLFVNKAGEMPRYIHNSWEWIKNNPRCKAYILRPRPIRLYFGRDNSTDSDVPKSS